MSQHLPAFPLQMLPIPGELIPLHIFEPRYRQLLSDAEEKDIEFVIGPTGSVNPKKIAAVVKLEQVIRRLPTGESDIVVRAIDFCTVTKINPFFDHKLYPGAEITRQKVDLQRMAGISLVLEFSDWQAQMKKPHRSGVISLFQIAATLHLDLTDRIRFATDSEKRREYFLIQRVKYEKRLMEIAEQSKRIYHLN